MRVNREKTKCCICEQLVDKESTFISMECLISYGEKIAHRICFICWWDMEFGFALENVSHKCPGCLKKIPFSLHEESEPIMIDLTSD